MQTPPPTPKRQSPPALERRRGLAIEDPPRPPPAAIPFPDFPPRPLLQRHSEHERYRQRIFILHPRQVRRHSFPGVGPLRWMR